MSVLFRLYLLVLETSHFVTTFNIMLNIPITFIVSGVLGDVKKEFDIGDDKAGLLQTVFVVAYMVFAPIFGYLGDRYSRRTIMAFGVALWSLTTFFGSFIGVSIFLFILRWYEKFKIDFYNKTACST